MIGEAEVPDCLIDKAEAEEARAAAATAALVSVIGAERTVDTSRAIRIVNFILSC